MVLLFEKCARREGSRKNKPVIAKKHKKRRLTLIFGTFCDSIVCSLYVLDNCVVQLNTEVFDFCKIMGTEP